VTTMQGLGTIERVDIREIWPNEAADFTPWLAENLATLGKALGLDLELQTQEAPVGGFSLDILARDVRSGRPVVIENQLGQTDHTHLGQLLTYAAGFDANVIVWIAKEFRDEHRQALDLLNHRTGEESEFFGVEVELWKIAESPAAVNFNLVSTPNEWRKQTVNSPRAGGPVSEKGGKYREFFQGLIDTLRERHQFTNAKKGQPLNWYSFSAGRTGFSYGVSFNRDGRARVELYIDTGERERNKQAYDWLEDQKASVESELKVSLEWERLDSRRASSISVRRLGTIDDDPETLKALNDWMIEGLLDFRRVFGPMLAELRDV
jgi:hypothetical protein